MDPALRELLLRADETDEDPEVEAIVRLRRPGLEVPKVRIVSRFGSIATCRLIVSAIPEVRRHPNVASLKAARSIGPEPEGPDWEETVGDPTFRPTDTRRPPGLGVTGAGVVVGAVDWGLDFDHPNFKNPDGTTRLLALWDQRDSGRPSPRPYGYGTVYSRDQINAALRTADPYGALGYLPARADRGGGSHGTHVMDIACGNGLAGGPMGLAPEAAMIFVDLADRDTGGLADLGGSVRLCEGVDFGARVAGARPWVLNLSVGRHGGPHDGRTLIELAFDELLDSAPGRFIAQSTGNYYQAGTHASGVLGTGQSQTLRFVTDPADMTDNEIEVWYDGNDEFTVRVDPPNAIGPEVRLGTRADIVVGGEVVGRVHHRARDPNNGDNHIDAFLFAPGHSGVWTLTLRAVRANRGRFDAWIERDEACKSCQARFVDDDRDPTSSTGTIANSHLPLVVGAYDAHQTHRPVARFSSSGPTRDGRDKPDFAAPGVDVLAARSAPAGALRSPGSLVRKSGSSMATPHVTGSVALCMQAGGHRLTARQIRAIVLDAADPAEFEQIRLGRGYLDTPALVAAVETAFPVRSRRAIDTEKEEPEMKLGCQAELPLLLAPATAYRELLYRPGGRQSQWIGERFDIVAVPGQALTEPPRPGDVLLTVSLGQPDIGACGVLTDAGLTHQRSAHGGGFYCGVSYGGAITRRQRILDTSRAVPHGHLLLRLRHSDADATVPIGNGSEAGDEAAAAPMALRSPRFVGDAELDAVLKGKLRLAAPGTAPAPAPVLSVGPAIAKVQQALIDLGYALTSFGADGRFGPETGTAVTRFKTNSQIQPNDPVVGRATIAALDDKVLAHDRSKETPPPPPGGTTRYVNASSTEADDTGESTFTIRGSAARQIADALKVANPGDTIEIIDASTYREGELVIDKPLTIISSFIKANPGVDPTAPNFDARRLPELTVKANTSTRVVRVAGTPATRKTAGPVVLKGLRITGGHSVHTATEAAHGAGGGIAVVDIDAVTIEQCVISSNTTTTAPIGTWPEPTRLAFRKAVLDLAGAIFTPTVEAAINVLINGANVLLRIAGRPSLGNLSQAKVLAELGAGFDKQIPPGRPNHWLAGQAFGGGIAAVWASPTLRRCLIRGNTAEGRGAGVAVVGYGWPRLESCWIDKNRSATTGRRDGGGIGCEIALPGKMSRNLSEVELIDFLAAQLGAVTATISSPLSAIAIADIIAYVSSGMPLVHAMTPLKGIKAVILDAIAGEWTLALHHLEYFLVSTALNIKRWDAWRPDEIVAAQTTAVVVSDCQISNNRCADDGGGLYASVLSRVQMAKTEVTQNTAEGCGGGVRLSLGSSGDLASCVLSGNTALAIDPTGKLVPGGGGLAARNVDLTLTDTRIGSGSAGVGPASNVCTDHAGGGFAFQSDTEGALAGMPDLWTAILTEVFNVTKTRVLIKSGCAIVGNGAGFTADRRPSATSAKAKGGGVWLLQGKFPDAPRVDLTIEAITSTVTGNKAQAKSYKSKVEDKLVVAAANEVCIQDRINRKEWTESNFGPLVSRGQLHFAP